MRKSRVCNFFAVSMGDEEDIDDEGDEHVEERKRKMRRKSVKDLITLIMFEKGKDVYTALCVLVILYHGCIHVLWREVSLAGC